MVCSVVVLCWTNLLIHFYQVVVSYSLKQVYNALKQHIIRMQGKIKRLNLFLWWNWCNLFNGLCSEIMRVLCFVNVLFLKVILILVWVPLGVKVPLGVIAIISKGYFWQIFNIIKKFVFRVSLSLIYQQCLLLWLGIGHTLISYKRNQIGAWNISCLWHL